MVVMPGGDLAKKMGVSVHGTPSYSLNSSILKQYVEAYLVAYSVCGRSQMFLHMLILILPCICIIRILHRSCMFDMVDGRG